MANKSKKLSIEDKVNTGYIDLTKTGPVSYRELRQANNALPEESFANALNSDNAGMRALQRAGKVNYTETPTGLGDSMFDPGIANQNIIENLQDYRAEAQPWYAQIGAGLAKGAVLAGTTFIDGTVGLLFGTGQGIANWFDEDPNTGFLSGLWDNDFSKALQKLNDIAEESMPNYYSQDELNSPWYENIFTSNFLGDKFIKNLGFAVGALYSGGVASAGLKATKLPQLIGAITNSTKAPAMVSTAVGAVTSAVNEGRIEALNNSRDWMNLKIQELDDAWMQNITTSYEAEKQSIKAGYEEALKEYEAKKGTLKKINTPEGVVFVDPAEIEYEQKIKALDARRANYEARMQAEFDNRKSDERYNSILGKITEDRIHMGNADLLMNIPILMASNMVQFAKFYANGFNTARRAGVNVTRKAGQEVLEYTGKTFSNGKAAAKAIGNSLTEGTEEISQKAASLIAGDYYSTDVNNFYKAQMDPNAEKESLDWMKSFANGINETVNDGSSWEEFFIGALTGLLGVPSFRSIKDANGKVQSPIKFEGGAYNAVKDYMEEVARSQEIANHLNARVQSPEFLNYYRGMIRHNKYQNDMNRAVEENDEFDFKNAEHAQLVSDIIMFDNAGRLSDLETYINMAFDTSDENIQSIIDNTTSESSHVFTDRQGNPMPKEQIIEKLTQNKDEILNAVKQYRKTKEDLDTRTGGVLSNEQLAELTWLELQIKNWTDRATDMTGVIKTTLTDLLSTVQGLASVETDSSMAEGFYQVANELQKALGTSDKALVSMLTAPQNIEFVEGLIKNISNFSGDQIGTLSKQRIIELLSDLPKIGRGVQTYTQKLDEYIRNPEKIAEAQAEAEEEVKQEVQDTQSNELKAKLSAATNTHEFREIFLNDESTNKEDTLNSLIADGNTFARDYKEIEDYNTELKKALTAQGEDTETLNDALTLWENQYALAENMQQIAYPDSAPINDETTFIEDSNFNDEVAGVRFEKARYALQKAISKVNNDIKFAKSFSPAYKKPAVEPINPKATTGASETASIPPVNSTSSTSNAGASAASANNPVIAKQTETSKSGRVRTSEVFEESRTKDGDNTKVTLKEVIVEDSKKPELAGKVITSGGLNIPLDSSIIDWNRQATSGIAPEEVKNLTEEVIQEEINDTKATMATLLENAAGEVGPFKANTIIYVKDGTIIARDAHGTSLFLKEDPLVTTSAPVGNISTEEVKEENKKLNDASEDPESYDSKNPGQKQYYRPAIPQLHIAASKEGDFRSFVEVVAEKEPGVDFSKIYEYLRKNGAFIYVNEGKLKSGDTLKFMIDPVFEELVANEPWHTAPTVFITTEDGQIVGSLDEGASMNNFVGLSQVIAKVREEYKQRQESNSQEKVTVEAPINNLEDNIISGHRITSIHKYAYGEGDETRIVRTNLENVKIKPKEKTVEVSFGVTIEDRDYNILSITTDSGSISIDYSNLETDTFVGPVNAEALRYHEDGTVEANIEGAWIKLKVNPLANSGINYETLSLPLRVVKPSYFEASKDQLRDKYRHFFKYADTTREVEGKEVITGPGYMETIAPTVKLACDAGILPKEYLEELDKLLENSIEMEIFNDVENLLMNLRIFTPEDLINYIEKYGKETSSGTSEVATKSANTTDPFYSTLTTKVSKIMVGKIPYSDEERSLSDIPGQGGLKLEPIFGIIKNGVLVTNKRDIDNLTIKPMDMSNKEGRLYLLIPNAAGTYSPAAVRVKHFNQQEFNLEDATVSSTRIGDTINKALNNLVEARDKDDVANAMRSLSRELYLQDVIVTWFDAAAGSGIVISKKVKKPNGSYEMVTINGQEKIKEDKVSIYFQGHKDSATISGIEYSYGAAKAMGADLSPFIIDKSSEEIKKEILDVLYKFNLPIQVSVSDINKGEYNKRIVESNILTSNLKRAEVIGNWFTTDYIDADGNIQKAVNPKSRSYSTTPSSSSTSPVGGTEGVATGTKVTIDGFNFTVDLKKRVLWDHEGKKHSFTKHNMAIVDMAWAQETYGDATEGSQMTDNKVITPSNQVLDRSTGRYLYGEEAQKVRDIISGKSSTGNQVSEEDKAKKDKADAIVAEIYKNQAKVDKTRTDDKYYYILEEDGEYHPYARVHTVLGDNWLGKSEETEASKFALKAGAAVDQVIRDFFSNKPLTRPEILSKEAFDSLISKLNSINAKMQTNKETFKTDNLVLYHKYPDGTRIAGEVDILSETKEGDFNIYDAKTSKYSFSSERFTKKSDKQRMSTKDYYTLQLSAYYNLFEAQYGVAPKALGIMPSVLTYDKKESPSIVSELTPENGIPITYNPNVPIPKGTSTTPTTSTESSTTTSSLPIFNSVAETMNPEDRVLPENAFEEGGEIGYYDLNGKLFTGYLKKIGEIKTTLASGQEITIPIHVTKVRDRGFGRPGEFGSTSEYLTVFPNGKAISTGTNSASDSEAASFIMNALSAKPEKVLNLSNEKTLLANPQELEESLSGTVSSQEGTASEAVQKELAVNKRSAKRVRHKLRAIDNTRPLWNKREELSWLKQILPQLSAEDRVRVVEGLIQVYENGPVAWGMFSEGIVTLSDLSAKGTTYHEAFHVVFNLMTDPEQRKALFKEAREIFGEKSEDELEEDMAEAFREYVMTKEERSLGQKIIDFFKNLFAKVTNWKYVKPSLYSYYRMIDQGAYKKSSLGSTSKTAFREEAYTKEMEDIKAKAIADGSFMKAPNGKPTNLNERQWLQVRTKNFIDWFGDWINDKENASKVIDENGEPMVVYHGSKAEFTVFDSSFNQKSNRGFFFSNNLAMAKSYGDIKPFFLNVRDVYDINGHGRNWNDLHVDILSYIPKLEDKIEMHRTLMRDAIERGVFSESSYKYWDKNFYQKLDFLKDESKNSVLDIVKKYVIRHQLKKFDSYFTLKSTRLIEKVFQTFDEDSNIIFRDITDYGSWVTDFAGANDVYVVTNPSNIKSATSNTGEFSPANKDVRYREVDTMHPSRFKDIWDYNRFISHSTSKAFMRNNLGVTWGTLTQQEEDKLVEKGWTKEKFNSISQAERDNVIDCLAL